MAHESIEESICCPKFEPAPWDGKVFEWKNKKFIKDSIFTLFYMPVNFGSVMKKLDKITAHKNAKVPDNMALSDHISKWKMDIYLAVDKKIQGAQNTTMSGTFVSKVYEGSFGETGKWHKNFKTWCIAQGHKMVKIYIWYTTCPKCAKKYGKNYVVFLAEVEKEKK